MAYFDGIKVGDSVWSFEYGWGKVAKIEDNHYPIFVEFNSVNKTSWYDYEGKRENNVKQTLFWDEIRFEIPQKPQIKLNEWKYIIDLIDENSILELDDKPELIDYTYAVDNGFARNNIETAEKAFKQIKRFARLLALRDQECEDSRGYEFQENKENWYLYYLEDEKVWRISDVLIINYPTLIYFKTRADAQKICDILNNGGFNLEGE